jgi:hypothetical protein
MTASVGKRGYPKMTAGMRGRTIAMSIPRASATTICCRKIYLFHNSITGDNVLSSEGINNISFPKGSVEGECIQSPTIAAGTKSPADSGLPA